VISVGCASVVALSGCGSSGDDGADSSGVELPNKPPRRVAAPPVDTTALQRGTPRPPGVSAQFDYVGGAGPGNCFGANGGPPGVRFFAQPFQSSRETPRGRPVPRATFGQAVDLCFDNFGTGPVRVVLRRPDGREVQGVLSGAAKGGSYDWVPDIEPDWLLGSYSVSARSSTGSASVRFTLAAPSRPGLRILGPSTDPGHNEIAPGSPAKLFLTGLRPMRSVRLDIYKSAEPLGANATYFGSKTVSVPTSGNAVVQLATQKRDESSTFIVTAKLPSETLAGAFTLMRPLGAVGTVVGPLPTG
jgi:hypothetical protein